jgi:hypothetical protein
MALNLFLPLTRMVWGGGLCLIMSGDAQVHDDDNRTPNDLGREVLFEIAYMGNACKVTAIDAETGVEVSIVGSPLMTKYSLKMNAMRKLSRVLSHIEEPEAGFDSPRPRKSGWYA